jgi:hypothetical protein
MHDGDQKEIQISGTSLVVRPNGNNQTWVVQSTIDPTSCSAVLDFNVKGKPNPPPVSLQASLWYALSYEGKKTMFGFTDPSGKLAPTNSPLNRWVEVVKAGSSAFLCPHSLNGVFVDIHDGDKKEITISGSALTIHPSDNDQVWEVRSTIDPKTCSGSVNFHVPGKPNPPPMELRFTLMSAISRHDKNYEIEFTDPSGTLASPALPLNHWVQVGSMQNGIIIL